MRHTRALLMIILVIVLVACSGGDSESNTGDTTDTQTGGAGNVADTDTTVADAEATAIAAGEATEDPSEGAFEDSINTLLTPSGAEGEADFFPTAIPEGEGALPIPLPGTLVASETEALEPIPDFDLITFRQQGGIGDIVVTFSINANATVERDGQVYPIDPSVVTQLNQDIRELNFFGLQGTYLGPARDDDAFTYRVFVQSGPEERAIQMQDGYIPLELQRFVGFIRQVGDSVVTN